MDASMQINDTQKVEPDLEVAVSYRLDEYQRVLRELVESEFLPTVDESQLLRFWNGRRAGDLVFALVVPLIFFWKKTRMGDCVFSFSTSGLSRATKGKTARRTWAQVKRVRRFSEAYLIELEEGGAMPLPFRAFSAAQQTRFETLLQKSGVHTPTWD